MTSSFLDICKCLSPHCCFRFPVYPEQSPLKICPKCGTPTKIITIPITNQEVNEQGTIPHGLEIEALFDNIRSSSNVGSMFRTADVVGIRHIHLCGITPTPDHPKITKSSLGAEFVIPWTQHWDSLSSAKSLKEQGVCLWALENRVNSQSLFESINKTLSSPILLIIGNEISGINPDILGMCDQTVWIPMLGIKRSLNVAVSFGTAAYFLRFSTELVSI